MAVNESQFNAGIRKDLKSFYPEALVWNNSDKFRSGLPDTSVLWSGLFFAIEGKFIKELPKRETSKCLTHEVSASQMEFINKVKAAEGYGCVLVGLPDVAALMLEIKPNYTLKEILAAPRVNRVGRQWDVRNLLSTIMGVA